MEKQIRTLKLMPEYGCFCVWVINDENLYDNVHPNELPISQELKNDLTAWQDKYQETFNDEYPPDSAFKSKQEQEQFVKDGENLQKKLQQELGDGYMVNLSVPKD